VTQTPDAQPHTVSVVIPVYQGAATLPALMDEIAPLVAGVSTPEGRPLRVTEVLLVHDNGPDTSREHTRGCARSG
jgi:undecaprenyl-phosphate 4-deoxy-4-formamido-L-arabinose transferase